MVHLPCKFDIAGTFGIWQRKIRGAAPLDVRHAHGDKTKIIPFEPY